MVKNYIANINYTDVEKVITIDNLDSSIDTVIGKRNDDDEIDIYTIISKTKDKSEATMLYPIYNSGPINSELMVAELSKDDIEFLFYYKSEDIRPISDLEDTVNLINNNALVKQVVINVLNTDYQNLHRATVEAIIESGELSDGKNIVYVADFLSEVVAKACNIINNLYGVIDVKTIKSIIPNTALISKDSRYILVEASSNLGEEENDDSEPISKTIFNYIKKKTKTIKTMIDNETLTVEDEDILPEDKYYFWCPYKTSACEGDIVEVFNADTEEYDKYRVTNTDLSVEDYIPYIPKYAISR